MPNSPKPSRGLQPEKMGYRPPLTSPLANGRSPSPPAPPGSLSSWDQRGVLPSLDTPRQGTLAVYPCTLSGNTFGTSFLNLFPRFLRKGHEKDKAFLRAQRHAQRSPKGASRVARAFRGGWAAMFEKARKEAFTRVNEDFRAAAKTLDEVKASLARIGGSLGGGRYVWQCRNAFRLGSAP